MFNQNTPEREAPDRAVSCMKTVTGKPAKIKGYIRRVDNPGVVQQMRRNIETSGVKSSDITVGNDPRLYLRSLEPGTVVVVNSLFDLSSDISGIMETLREAFSRNIAIQSLRDGGAVIDASRTKGRTLLDILGTYNALSAPSYPVLETSAERRRSGYTISPGRTETYMTALKYFNDGYPMTRAAEAAGCSYPSFRYWYHKNYAKAE